MRIIGMSVCALSFLLVGSFACGGFESSGAEEPTGSQQLDTESLPVVNCRTRTQFVQGRASWEPLSPRTRRISVVAGPVAFLGAKELVDYSQRPELVVQRARKVPIRVETGSAVRIAIAPTARRHAVLLIDRDRGPNVRGPAVELRPCPPDAEVAGRRVGPFTYFGAGFKLDRPTCVRLEVKVVDESRSYHRRIPIGRRCGHA